MSKIMKYFGEALFYIGLGVLGTCLVIMANSTANSAPSTGVPVASCVSPADNQYLASTVNIKLWKVLEGGELSIFFDKMAELSNSPRDQFNASRIEFYDAPGPDLVVVMYDIIDGKECQKKFFRVNKKETEDIFRELFGRDV